MKGRTIICDDRDEDLWHAARRFYLTASDLYTFGGLGDAWWPGSKTEILDEKVFGIPKQFGGDDPVKQEIVHRKMAHGWFNEENNRRKFSHFSKLRTRPAHYLITHERWPWLAATLDALIEPPKRAETIIPDVFTDPAHVQSIRDRMVFAAQGTGICELKQTENKASYRNQWFGYTNRKGAWVPGYGPAYNQPQVQAQMHITGCRWAVLVGQIGAIHMQAHLFERDESFAEWLDIINEKFRVERHEWQQQKRA